MNNRNLTSQQSLALRGLCNLVALAILMAAIGSLIAQFL